MEAFRPLFKLEVTVEADLSPVSAAGFAAFQAWHDRVEAVIAAAGMPAQRAVTARIVPTPELLEFLASGRAFRVESDLLFPVGGGAKDFAPRPVPADLPLTIVTDPPEDAPGADVTGVPV